MEQFIKNYSRMPTNIETVVMIVGHNRDFISDCTYFNVSRDFSKKHDLPIE